MVAEISDCMICDFYGGPNDGGTMVISDDRCDIGTVHEWASPVSPEPDEILTHDFADPAAVYLKTVTARYRLIGIVNRLGILIGHLQYIAPQ